MIARHDELHDPKLKPKIRGDYRTWNCWLSFVLNVITASSSQTVGRERGVRVICASSVCRSVVYNDRLLFYSNNRADSGVARPS